MPLNRNKACLQQTQYSILTSGNGSNGWVEQVYLMKQKYLQCESREGKDFLTKMITALGLTQRGHQLGFSVFTNPSFHEHMTSN